MTNRGGEFTETALSLATGDADKTSEPTGNVIDPDFLPGRNSAGDHGRTSPLHARPPLLPSISFPLGAAYASHQARSAGKSLFFTAGLIMDHLGALAGRPQFKAASLGRRPESPSATIFIDEYAGAGQ